MAGTAQIDQDAANIPSLGVAGLTGATAASRWVGATTYSTPVTGTFAVGDYLIDRAEGRVWICVVAGSPGTWKPAGPTPALGIMGLVGWG